MRFVQAGIFHVNVDLPNISFFLVAFSSAVTVRKRTRAGQKYIGCDPQNRSVRGNLAKGSRRPDHDAAIEPICRPEPLVSLGRVCRINEMRIPTALKRMGRVAFSGTVASHVSRYVRTNLNDHVV